MEVDDGLPDCFFRALIFLMEPPVGNIDSLLLMETVKTWAVRREPI